MLIGMVMRSPCRLKCGSPQTVLMVMPTVFARPVLAYYPQCLVPPGDGLPQPAHGPQLVRCPARLRAVLDGLADGAVVGAVSRDCPVG